MPFNIGAPELLIVLVVVLIVFGAGRLPAVMGDLGRGMREFKRAQDEPPAAPMTLTTPPPIPGTNGTTGGPATAASAASAASAATAATASAPAPDVARARA